jgi:hypothetical protein
LLAAIDDPSNVLRLVSSTDVRSGVSEPPQYRDHARRAFQPRSFAFVFRLGFLADLFHQFRRDPASRRLALRHFFRRLQAENVDVTEKRFLDAALVEILLQLSEFPGVVAKLRDRVIRTRREFLFELEILIGTIGFRVLERGYGDANPDGNSMCL